MPPYSPIQKALGGHNPVYGSDAPVATGGKQQPRSPRGPKIRKVKVKSHTRAVKPPATPQKTPSVDAHTKQLIDAAVRLKFGGEQQAINQRLQQNARFTSGVPSWYQDAVNSIKGLGATSAAQSAQTLQNVQAYSSPTSQTGTPEAAQAATARNNLNSQYGAMIGANAQANQDWLTRLQGAMHVQQGNTLNQANVERQQLMGQKTGLAQQKADFRLSTRADIDAGQAKADIEDRKLQASIAIAGGKLDLARDILNNVTKPKTRAQIKTSRQNARTQSRSQKETAKQHRVDNAIKVNNLALKSFLAAHPELKEKSTGTKGKSKFTDTQRRKAASTFRTYAGQLDENAVHKNPNGAVNALVKGKKVDPVVANAVVESIVNHGSVTRDTATAYFRATGHHLHVSKKAKRIPGDLGKIVSGFLQGL